MLEITAHPHDQAAAQAASEWSLPAPRLVHRGTTSLYWTGDRLVSAGDRGERALAQCLRDRGHEVLTPQNDAVHQELEVILWREEPVDGRPDLYQVGRSLARLHAEKSVDIEAALQRELVEVIPIKLQRARSVLSGPLEEFDPVAVDLLREQLARVSPRLEAIRQVDLVVCHGDLDTTALVTTHNTTRLAALSGMCLAPPMWDTARLAAGAICFESDPWWTEQLHQVLFSQRHKSDELSEWMTFALIDHTIDVLERRSDPLAQVQAQQRISWWGGYAPLPSWFRA